MHLTNIIYPTDKCFLDFSEGVRWRHSAVVSVSPRQSWKFFLILIGPESAGNGVSSGNWS